MFRAAVFFLALLVCGVVQGKTYNLTLITTSATNPNYTTVKPHNYGGYAVLKTAVSTLQTSLGSTPLINFHGITALGFSMFTQYYQGQREYWYIQGAGFQYITFGSRDFFYGPAVYANNFLAPSTLKMVMSNALISKTSPLGTWHNRYQIVTKTDPNTNESFKVAIVAYVVGNFCQLTQCADPAGATPHIQISDVITGMTSFLADMIFVEQPDIVVAVSSGTDFGYDIQVAQTVPGINVIMASDTRTTLSGPMIVTGPAGNNVIMVNDYHSLGLHGLMTLRMSFTDGTPTWWSANLDPMLTCQDDAAAPSGCIVADSNTLTQLNSDNIAPVQSTSQVVGTLNTQLIGSPTTACRRQECSTGSMVADAILWKMGADQCDATLVNGGMFRTNLNAGSVKVSDVRSLLPNVNTVAITKIRGADIFDAFRNGFNPLDPEPGAGGKFPQVANLKVSFNSNNSAAFRVVEVKIFNSTTNTYIDMDPNQVYNLCTNDYMLGGGDSYGVLLTSSLGTFRQGPQVDVLVQQYFAALSPVGAPVSGRITDLFSTLGKPSPPLVGACTATVNVAGTAGQLADACDGGYRATTSQTWVITPPSALSIYTTFSGNFTLNPATDTLCLSDTATGLPILVPPMFGHSDLVAANFTTLPTSAVGAPNVASLTIKLVSNRPITGAGIKMSYTSDSSCPGGYILTSGQCVPCAAGSYATKGSSNAVAAMTTTTCTPCAAGTIAYSRGMSACVPCESGTFLTTTGGTECQACDGGRVSVSSTVCSCPAGLEYNGILCLETSKSEAGPIAGIAVGVLVAGAGAAFYAYRRRMAAIKRRHLGIQKHKKIKADVAMARIVQDIMHAGVQIGLDIGECFLDWHAFLEVSATDPYRLGFIASCIFQSLITFLSAAIRIYNMVSLLKIRTQGVKLIAAGAKITSVEALARIHDAQKDVDLHMVLLNLRTLKQKVIITIAVAIPGVMKSLPMLIVNALVAREQTSAGLTLLLAFGFNCLVFAVNIQETLGWFSLKHHYSKQKALADAKLKELGLKRPEDLLFHPSSNSQVKEVTVSHPQVILKSSHSKDGPASHGAVHCDDDEISDEENRGGIKQSAEC
ncbi:hypothetical protein HDU87_004557 [Geranomyces variabilis]|uniref:5'-Nucleotidase C-terminal domain-containing protein n=1 Tax=Geranomyces variabilis TaxID=109894 RepID=A0AAD5TI48_9FUNG|nr:hypothetical protein HDU87_004557 [Geranomyces variabilis]